MRFLLPLFLGLLLTACSSKSNLPPQVGTVTDLYNSGLNSLMVGETREAVHSFSELERQHPYSGWATRAQMMIAYTHYRAGKMDEAIAAAERFIRLHPGHKDLPYVYYLRAMAFYTRISDVTRDQGYTRQALESFEEIMRRFPNTTYARDAKFKATLCRDHLAGKEMNVARWYLGQKRYLAAINRYKTVVKEYETSTHTPEALYRLTEAYVALGVDDEARRSAAVLGHNFPDNKWYEKAYNLLTKANLAPANSQRKGWATKIFQGLKDTF